MLKGMLSIDYYTIPRKGIICIEVVNAEDLRCIGIRSDLRRPIKNKKNQRFKSIATANATVCSGTVK